ncbi:MAG: hypothetical protein A4E54_01542 [Pelotomaculum sp. PtaB.Bin117]|nr:MAG: hypothetical protein A4E54_01542 [Pelotomaculum sp. PtaB.Bin117]
MNIKEHFIVATENTRVLFNKKVPIPKRVGTY